MLVGRALRLVIRGRNFGGRGNRACVWGWRGVLRCAGTKRFKVEFNCGAFNGNGEG